MNNIRICIALSIGLSILVTFVLHESITNRTKEYEPTQLPPNSNSAATHQNQSPDQDAAPYNSISMAKPENLLERVSRCVVLGGRPHNISSFFHCPCFTHITKKPTKDETQAVIRQKIDRHIHDMTPPIAEHETILTSFIISLISENRIGNRNVILIPEGSFLDAGCQFGEQAAHYAISAPDREVIALDPSPSNLEIAQRKFGDLSNLVFQQGGLGQHVGTMKVPDSSFQMPIGSEFLVYTLDSLFYDQGKKLGFAHLDLEGLELDVLKGGVNTIKASKPLFTTEVRVHKDPQFTTDLLEFISELGYDSYVINESCGFPHMDYRNLLNIPRSKSTALRYSEVFILLHATQSLIRVPTKGEGQKTIFDIVVPCCALGGACCPGSEVNAKDCCSEALLKIWLDKNKPNINPYTYFWKEARQEFGRLGYRLRQRQKSSNE